MRIGSRQLAGSTRTASLLAACVSLVATTTGLLLAIHLLTVDHCADHNSDHCAICQQLLVVSKETLLVPSVAIVRDCPIFRAAAPVITEHVEACYPQVLRPRGPPLSTYPM